MHMQSRLYNSSLQELYSNVWESLHSHNPGDSAACGGFYFLSVWQRGKWHLRVAFTYVSLISQSDEDPFTGWRRATAQWFLWTVPVFLLFSIWFLLFFLTLIFLTSFFYSGDSRASLWYDANTLSTLSVCLFTVYFYKFKKNVLLVDVIKLIILLLFLEFEFKSLKTHF